MLDKPGFPASGWSLQHHGNFVTGPHCKQAYFPVHFLVKRFFSYSKLFNPVFLALHWSSYSRKYGDEKKTRLTLLYGGVLWEDNSGALAVLFLMIPQLCSLGHIIWHQLRGAVGMFGSRDTREP